MAFSNDFVEQVQSNQRERYKELMRAFTMSAAETARKTREFRSPPHEQVLCDTKHVLYRESSLFILMYTCMCVNVGYSVD